MKFLKFACVPALALALVGCGGSEPSAATAARSYEPKVAEGSYGAVQYRKNSSKALAPLAEAARKCFNQGLEAGKKGNGEVAKFDDDVVKFLNDSGLKDADLEWGLVTLGNVSVADMTSGKAPDLAVALCFKHDIARIVDAIKANLDAEDGEKIESATVAGVAAWTASSKDFPPEVKPAFASLDGTLLIGASSVDVLARQIALYRDGKGADASFAKLSSDSGALFRLYVKDVGGSVAKAIKGSEDMLDAANMVLPDGKNIILGLGELDFSITGSDTAGAAVALRLATRSADDANNLQSLIGGGLVPLRAQFQNAEDEQSKSAYELLSALKIAAKDSVFTADLPLSDKLVKDFAAQMLQGAAAVTNDESDDADDVDAE